MFQVSEAREGVVVQQILSTGSFILPLRHGETVPSKPILFHWLSVITSLLSGELTEFELRFPSALAAVGTVFITAHLSYILSGFGAMFLTAAVLLSTYGFLHLAIDGRVDMVFCFFVVTAVCLWLISLWGCCKSSSSLSKISNGRYRTIAILCGLAMLTKGPLGLVLPLLVISTIAAIYERGKGISEILRPSWVWALVISVPWYVLATVFGRDSFIARQLVFENVARFFGSPGIAAKPWSFYLRHFWTQAAPWSLAILCIVLWQIYKKIRTQPEEIDRSDAPEDIGLHVRSLHFSRIVCLTWFTVGVLFLSISSGKRRAYLLPMLPALAIYLGVYLSYALSRCSPKDLKKAKQIRLFGRGVFLLVVFSAVSILLLGAAQPSAIASLCADCGATISSIPVALARAPALLAAFSAVLLPSSIIFWELGWGRGKTLYCALGVFCLLQFVFVVIVNSVLAVKGVTHSYRTAASEVSELVPNTETLSFIKKIKDESFDGFFFYYKRHANIHRINQPVEKPGYYITRQKWLKKIKGLKTADRNDLYRGGRLVDTPDEQLVLFHLR